MLDVLRRRLRCRNALIILDNCEHVLDACAQLMEHLLGAASTLRLLATSREAIGLPAEVVWQVPSLPMPRHPGGLTELARFDAVRLFSERARTADPSFRLDEANVAAVAQICRQLDGIPLAIELAAALAPALRPREIAAALDDCLRLLTGGSRAGIPRHRTLRASMEWSHALLDESEQVLFRRLAVFPDSFSLDAVRGVCADAPLPPGDVVATVASLVRRSLVTVDEGSSMSRYRLLQTVRQYAGECLAEAGETTVLRDRHLAYAIGLVEQEPAPDLRDEWLDRLDEERGGLRAALDWAIERGDRAAPLRLAVGLGLLFHVRAYLAEGRRFFADALAASDPAASRLRAQALWGLAYVAFAGMDIPVAVDQATAAVQVARAVGDSQTAARALTLIGGARMGSEPQRARKYLEEAILLAGEARDNWCRTLALGHTGQSYLNQNKLELARRYSAEAAEIMDPRNRRFQAWSAAVRSSIVIRGGDIAAARRFADRANTLAAEVGDPNCLVWTALSGAEIDCWRGRARQALDAVNALAAQLDSVGRVPTVAMRIHAAAGTCALALGELTRAEQDLTRSMTLAREIPDSVREAASMVDLAEIALLRGQPHEARVLLHVVAQRAELLDDAWLSAAAKVRLARAARMSGDLTAARDLAYEALALQRAGGYQLEVISTLETVAGLHVAMGNPMHAARLTGAATAVRRRLGARRSRLDDLRHRPDRIGLANALDQTALRHALAEGGQLSLAEAIAYSMRGRGKRARPATGWQSLTPTEVAVARLVAQGCTNPEIARRMFISLATVKKHLSQIFAKTGITHRAELAAHVERQAVGGAAF
jgi:predicted ATPase/DNA-binding CsgD family transcriptional regulator